MLSIIKNHTHPHTHTHKYMTISTGQQVNSTTIQFEMYKVQLSCFIFILHSLLVCLCIYCIMLFCFSFTLRWRHNGQDGVSNHQPHGCLLNRLFRRRSNKTPKLRVTGLCVGNSPGPVNSPLKGPVTRKMFPFDDVIMMWACDIKTKYPGDIYLNLAENKRYLYQILITRENCRWNSFQLPISTPYLTSLV